MEVVKVNDNEVEIKDTIPAKVLSNVVSLDQLIKDLQLLNINIDNYNNRIPILQNDLVALQNQIIEMDLQADQLETQINEARALGVKTLKEILESKKDE